MSDLAGILPVDKPAGPTSHDVISAARRALGTRRIGHTGTLDPFATGLLLLCVGSATRLAEYLTPLPKTYRAVMRLGQATDTDDLAGEVIRSSDAWAEVSETAVRAALLAQQGELEQVPPLYSAKKVAGERMYAAARRGEAPERKPARVTIHRLELLDVRLPDVEFEVECSSGTYIRALARDAGEALGVGAHLRELRRTASGRFRVEDAVPLDSLGDTDRVHRALVSPAGALSHLPSVTLDADQAAAIGLGRRVPSPPDLEPEALLALLGSDGELLAVGETRGAMIQPRKVFA